MTLDEPLKITIVGGGIGGLVTAIALRGPGRRITVLERSRMLREVGATISLQPNASRIIDSWGLAPFLEACKPLSDQAFMIRNAAGKLVNTMTFDRARFGADRVMYHRQDLHSALRRAAESTDRPGPPAVIRTACRVVGCDLEEGAVLLEGGEVVCGDVVVGADGIRSALRDVVVGKQCEIHPTGLTAYRIHLPRSIIETAVRDHGAPPEMGDLDRPGTTMILGHERRVLFGPARGGELYGGVCLVPDDQLLEALPGEAWNGAGSKKALLASFEGFPDWFLAMIKLVADEDIGLWQLRDIDPLDAWSKGRAILIGDAAHAMLPTQGQGASQAVEDAEALQAYLADLPARPTGDQVCEALRKVWEVRHQRAILIQNFSRAQGRHNAGADASGKVTMNPGEFLQFNCSYLGAKDWEVRMKEKKTGMEAFI
ncbi:hypothetical protein MCOR27_002435 [Pyricularia oryzae]|nr:hypothetical protein MCOR01_002622 [Pyricularia oryzae]KAI6256224.1 hypothetical protein MCOR19_007293 [Pyricularia oryzae]KAI6285067.1 hypothetical protein MCOR27_002435 [Pyricularia oryzae]KAI6361444.1 hypothetical protein MCOR31_008694 [Pyricularia oryzae]KAI6367918.1 hypothetical protein MCOR32_007025 [Pyricularia oryzae]